MIPSSGYYAAGIEDAISTISKQATESTDEIAKALAEFRNTNRAVVGISSALLVIVFVFAMVCFVLAVILLLNKAKRLVSRFEKNGQTCKATVTNVRLDEKEELVGGNYNSNSYSNPSLWTVYAWVADYKYVVNDITYVNKASIERYPLANVGEEIEVIYLPNNPVVSIRKELLQNVGWFYSNISETGENIRYTRHVPHDPRVESTS